MEIIDFYVLDTHSLIWHLAGDERLGKNAKVVLEDENNKFVLPMIALAEAFDIVQKKRTKIPNVESLWQDVFADSRIKIQPLTIDILLESQNALTIPEMHDRLITATALSLEKEGLSVAVVTKDSSIIESKLVKIIW